MPVYVVNAYNINDPETFKNYPPQVGPLLVKHGAKLLAMDTNARTLEGTPKTMNVIVEFSSQKAVDDFYNNRNTRRSFTCGKILLPIVR